ncbi:MAG: hypothetical protein A3G20_04625 [Acidobacteria bacterium RIFCSPLOWO2_12_FULL_59_11]|nr:MAG: hypothetical protein A3G20_04625 [Acidobacteria bacterium RIFCSPLOWO2_12_FULL_59_11]
MKRGAFIKRGVLPVTLAVGVLLPLHGGAQQSVAAVKGIVTDADGKPVPGTLLVARHLGTGQSVSSQSGNQGDFLIQPLSPGRHQIQASYDGRGQEVEQTVELNAGQQLTLNFMLPRIAGEEPAPGKPAAEPPPTAAANLISESQLLGLPLNGRSYSQLATLQAGVSDSSAASASRGVGGGNLSVSGSRNSSNHFLLDGTTIMTAGNSVPRSAAGVQLGSDTVYQVQVFATGYGSEYGRSSGGVLNSITRSGSNQFHGTLFEYFRNSKLDARNFFDRDQNPPPFKRNQFGFTLAGPVRKDQTFFLFSYEGLRDRLTQTNISFFPDEEARRGFPDANGVPTVPVAPSVQPYLALIPVPNDLRLGNGVGRNVASQFLPTNEDFFTVRVDHKVSDRDSVFVRYTFDDASGQEPQDSYLFQTVNQTRQQYLTAVGTHIFNLRALTAFRFGYTKPQGNSKTQSQMEIPRSLYFHPEAPKFGQIVIPGLSTFGPHFSQPQTESLESFQFSNQFLVQQGPHALKFGAEVHRYRLNSFIDAQSGGVWTFNSLRGFLLAGPVGTTLGVALPGSDSHHQYRQTLLGLYVHDEYRVSPRLQISMGLRYEPVTKIGDETGRIVFVPDLVKSTGVEFGDFFRGNPSLRNFAPRLGLTWSPWGGRGTVISSAFGVYYDPILIYVGNRNRFSTPYYQVATSPNLDTSQVFPNALRAAATVPFLFQGLDYNNMSSGMVLRYHFTLQQPLPGGWRVQASYVGSRGNHLYRRSEVNQFTIPIVQPDNTLFFPSHSGPLNPAFGSMNIISTDAQSFYNAFQVTAGKSLSGGLTMQSNYTFSKSVDDDSSGLGGGNFPQYPHRRTLDRGLSDFDIRHRLVFNSLYSLPFGSGRPWWNGGPLSRLFGGWRVGGIFNVRTGTPFSAQASVRYKDYIVGATRSNLLPGANHNPTEGGSLGCGRVRPGQELGGPDLYFDPCVFSVPPPGTLGNVGRNTLLAPSILSVDVSLQREFLLDSKRRLQFRADLFNLPNHPNFVGPSSVVFSGEAGDRTSTAGRISRPATTSRQIQFALRLSF